MLDPHRPQHILHPVERTGDHHHIGRRRLADQLQVGRTLFGHALFQDLGRHRVGLAHARRAQLARAHPLGCGRHGGLGLAHRLDKILLLRGELAASGQSLRRADRDDGDQQEKGTTGLWRAHGAPPKRQGFYGSATNRDLKRPGRGKVLRRPRFFWRRVNRRKIARPRTRGNAEASPSRRPHDHRAGVTALTCGGDLEVAVHARSTFGLLATDRVSAAAARPAKENLYILINFMHLYDTISPLDAGRIFVDTRHAGRKGVTGHGRHSAKRRGGSQLGRAV